MPAGLVGVQKEMYLNKIVAQAQLQAELTEKRFLGILFAEMQLGSKRQVIGGELEKGLVVGPRGLALHDFAGGWLERIRSAEG